MATSAKKTENANPKSPDEERAHIHEMLEKISDVMFLSFASVGQAPVLDGRPLHVTAREDDNTLWFMVPRDSKKVAEVQRHSGAVVTAQTGSRWLAMSGIADVVNDRAKIESLWSKAHEVWFPNGPQDPNVCLLRFRPESAEYWDNSGMLGVKYLLAAAKAFVTGTQVEPVEGSHGEMTRGAS